MISQPPYILSIFLEGLLLFSFTFCFGFETGSCSQGQSQTFRNAPASASQGW